MSQETILIIDDEKEIRDLIGIYLNNEGYNVLKAADGLEGLKFLEENNVHLVVLDIMMPRLDGIQACLKIRESRNVPIIMLSAKSQDMDKIMGLTTGADDYVTKPFQPLELVARIKSQLRRYLRLNHMDGAQQPATPQQMDVISIDDLLINVSTHEVTVEGKEIKLTPREFAILELLARNPGVVFSTEKIYERVWNEPFYESENTVMVHIRNLREKLEHNPRTPKYIKTVWGSAIKLNNKKPILPFLRSGGYLDKLVQLVKTSIRIQVIIGFVFCIAISTLVGLAASPFFVNEDRRLDFTEGVVTIDESARDLVRQFNEINQDLNGLVIELGDQDPAFKKKFLNRVQTNHKDSQQWITVPYEGKSVYRITKNELVQYLITKPNLQNNLHALITNSDGKVLFKSQGVNETEVNIQDEISKSQETLIGKEHNKAPTVTRIYQFTLEGRKHYNIVSGVPKSTTVYMKETGVTPYVLGVLTFILCFYLITKRKMREIEEIALGLMEIAKGNLKYRIREKSQDELGSLATNINYMASELDEMIERQRENEN